MACSPDSGGQFPSVNIDGIKDEPHSIHHKCLQRLLIPDIIMRAQVVSPVALKTLLRERRREKREHIPTQCHIDAQIKEVPISGRTCAT